MPSDPGAVTADLGVVKADLEALNSAIGPTIPGAARAGAEAMSPEMGTLCRDKADVCSGIGDIRTERSSSETVDPDAETERTGEGAVLDDTECMSLGSDVGHVIKKSSPLALHMLCLFADVDKEVVQIGQFGSPSCRSPSHDHGVLLREAGPLFPVTTVVPGNMVGESQEEVRPETWEVSKDPDPRFIPSLPGPMEALHPQRTYQCMCALLYGRSSSATQMS